MAIISRNPATGELNGEFSEDSDVVLEKKLATAQSTYKSWKSITYTERAEILMKVASDLKTNVNEYAAIITSEMGKPILQSQAEVKKCAWVCEYFAENGEKFLKPQLINTESASSYVRFDPLGVILTIMPWNFPFWQFFRFSAATLMAGNVVALKHASNMPLTAQAISKVFARAGAPEGLFTNLVIGSSRVEKVISDDRIVGVMLTGSETAGRKVAAQAGAVGKKVVLELGGSDPFIVLKDADIEMAVNTCALARLQNAGQVCICTKRIIVEQAIAQEFQEKLIARFESYRMGDPLSSQTEIGPLVSEDAVQEVEKIVADSLALGAKLLTGGKRPEGVKGSYYLPTILGEITPDMPIFKDEVFGPAVPLCVVPNADAALELANNSRFGLGASLWTKDEKIIKQFAAGLEVGTVYVNGMVVSDPRLPVGGIKASGFGRELGEFGIKEFVNIKAVVIKAH